MSIRRQLRALDARGSTLTLVGEVSVEALDHELRVHADPDRAVREKAYLKSELTHYGVSVPTLHRLAKATGRHLDRQSLLRLATGLWDEPTSAPVHERRYLAADLLAHRVDLLEVGDIAVLERLLRQSRTWALVDTLAPSVVGPLDERLPGRLDATLDRWVEDDDFWMRRAALLTHLIPLRRQRGDWPRFCRYADDLLTDREFFVAKAIGWVLRDTARRRPNLVLDWVEPRVTRMQSVTFREVLKPFSAEVQQRLRDYRSHH